MIVYWATRLRGFLKHISIGSNKISFVSSNRYYETNNAKQKLTSRIIRSKMMDYLGFFQIISINKKDCNCYASFNRFLKTDKPYFIYLENPTALYHYSLNRIKYPSGKKRFSSCINDPNLRGIAFMSETCKKTFEKINGELPKRLITQTIYPLVPNNTLVNEKTIEKKSKQKILELLYCVQGIRFISKGGLEVIEAIKNLRNAHLTVITKISDIDNSIIDNIRKMKNVTLLDFNLSYEKLERIYADTNILLQPTSDDSFGLTILEAMKGGCAIIASKLYSIPEIVQNEHNGILIEPKFWFFDKNGMPNPKVWNHRKKTLYSTKTSQRIINELRDIISELNNNRNLLEKYSLNSYRSATDDSFLGEHGIRKQWEDFIYSIMST